MGAAEDTTGGCTQATAHSLYQSLIRDADSEARIIEPPPLAPSIAALAEAALRERGASTPDAIRPIYVRRSDAELVRDGKTALRVGTASE